MDTVYRLTFTDGNYENHHGVFATLAGAQSQAVASDPACQWLMQNERRYVMPIHTHHDCDNQWNIYKEEIK